MNGRCAAVALVDSYQERNDTLISLALAAHYAFLV